VPVQAWVDDSGDEGQGPSPSLVLGGLVGRAEDWAVFSDLWKKGLAESPAILYFKMKQAAGRSGQFYGFTAEQRDGKLRRLANIIDQFHFDIVHVTVETTGFSELFEHQPKPADTPYFFAFLSVIYVAYKELRERGEKERFEMIFDEQLALGPKVKAWYPVMRAGTEADEPGAAALLPIDLLFRDDKEFVPLQAADMIAWLRRKRITDHSFDWLEAEMPHTKVSVYSQELRTTDLAVMLANAEWAPPEVQAEADRLFHRGRGA
jgi:hypothetical protein